MKNKLVLLIALFPLAISSVFAQFEIKLSDELFISKISDTVYVATHYFPWESNSLIIKASGKEVVLIDTPYDTGATTLMLNWINSNMKPEKITAFNTGFHIDNLGGNECLLKNAIDIYGSDLTVKLIDERAKQTQQQIISMLTSTQDRYRKYFETVVFYKPNKVYKINEGLFLKVGDLSFDVFYPGESHSPDNVVIYIKELKLLFGGCMIKPLSGRNLGFTGDANISEWTVSVKKVQEKFNQAKFVIPHHGMWGDKSLIQHTLDLLVKEGAKFRTFF